MKNPEDEVWWEFVNQSDNTYQIQWTPADYGVVRARVDSITPWSYKTCGKADYALSYGNRLIAKQKRRK